MYIGVGLLIVRLNLPGLAIAVATISNPLERLR
jgi:hypothetical protein